MRFRSLPNRTQRRAAASLVALAASATSTGVLASFLSGEALDSAASGIAWFVICVVPIVVIVLFWLVHVMPEKIAHKRHHPQKDAIHVLCLLSLVFGGLLWPIAWLWAYTKPVVHRLAYGTDKHEDYYGDMGDKARAGELLHDELAHLREELDAMAASGQLPPRLKSLRRELDTLQIGPAADEVKAGGA